MFTTSPILRLHDPTFNTFLYTNASRKSIGTVLKQANPANSTNTQFVVGYFYRSLQTYQQNYSVTELELIIFVDVIVVSVVAVVIGLLCQF